MKKNKIIAFALSLCLTVGLVPSIAANASVKSDNKVKVESKVDTSTSKTTTVVPTKPNSEIQVSGIKKKAVVYALKYGGPILADIVEYLGDEELAALVKANSYEIGAFLETVSSNFEAELVGFMIHDLSFSQSNARIIADAIMQVLF